MHQDTTWYGGRPQPRWHCVRWDPAPQPPVFGPCLLWPNGWMDEDATWYGSRPRPRPHHVRWGPSSSPKNGVQQPPLFSPHVCCGHGRPSQLLLISCICEFTPLPLKNQSYFNSRIFFSFSLCKFFVTNLSILSSYFLCPPPVVVGRQLYFAAVVTFFFLLLGWQVWGTPANFRGFRVLASLLHRRKFVMKSVQLAVNQSCVW